MKNENRFYFQLNKIFTKLKDSQSKTNNNNYFSTTRQKKTNIYDCKY